MCLSGTSESLDFPNRIKEDRQENEKEGRWDKSRLGPGSRCGDLERPGQSLDLDPCVSKPAWNTIRVSLCWLLSVALVKIPNRKLLREKSLNLAQFYVGELIQALLATVLGQNFMAARAYGGGCSSFLGGWEGGETDGTDT